ncbi:hypothetical protein PAHAL_5G299800 [Panicum hallii]|uniref:Uncharacterized protein n=1 Tax=Panicum hallii TaxID=206008 RepID=A0A2T8ILQ3_9POAL|nr:hypothetical protein PAHAL_5G299800 [Panicum hallii]
MFLCLDRYAVKILLFHFSVLQILVVYKFEAFFTTSVAVWKQSSSLCCSFSNFWCHFPLLIFVHCYFRLGGPSHSLRLCCMFYEGACISIIKFILLVSRL